MMRTHYCGSLTEAQIDQTVTLCGWVHRRRDHGGVIFLDMRDRDGLVQVVIDPDTPEAFATADKARSEFVLKITGRVRRRYEGTENANMVSGQIEVLAKEIEVLAASETPPFPLNDENTNISEEIRLKYRFLDIRRPEMLDRLRFRSKVTNLIRNYFEDHGFLDVETPILTRATPEGARDYLVPSRVSNGSFYALPQSPQLFKQLLMVGGIDRYYQIAKCFRDEDLRADRQPEFTQIDVETSFMSDDDIMDLMEGLTVKMFNELLNVKFDKFERMTYADAMRDYASDKPDMRIPLKLVDVADLMQDVEFKVFAGPAKDPKGRIVALRVPGAGSLPRSAIDEYTKFVGIYGAKGLAYIKVNELEKGIEGLQSPIVKFIEPIVLDLLKRVGTENGDIVFFGADKREKVNKVLGALRISFADHFNLKDPNLVALCWIIDFPFYEWDDGAKKLDFGHNPFSMPKGGLAALEAAQTDEEKLAIVADQYDMVMNGCEICSGAVRNHSPEIMYKVFGVLGYDEKYVEERFGGMLNAFKFGAPPHTGCAYGIDRIFMVLENTENIRDIVAFPKNGSGADLMMGAPSVVDDYQITDCHLQLIPEDEE